MVANDKELVLTPLRPGRNLTEEVVERLTTEIRAGGLRPGQKLPTEAEMMAQLGVSRTVIREAVSALKAEGLVVTRQGAGAFVATDTRRVPFRIDPEGLSSIKDVIDVMELRLSIEIEAAALAAERAGVRERAAIRGALQAFDRAVSVGDGGVAEDFALHAAIAKATGNPQFVNFLTFLGRHVIPRHSIRVDVATQEEQATYLSEIQRDHHRIVEAVLGGQAGEARRQMRAHLANSLERYRGLAERSAAEGGKKKSAKRRK